MPWKLIQKTYGKDPRVDAKYHIKYQSSFLSFDLVCSYLNESYRWVLNSETLGVKGIILGESPKMTDGEAGPAAVEYLRKFLDEKQEDLDMATESFKTQILTKK